MNGFYFPTYFSSWGCLTKTLHVRINIILELNSGCFKEMSFKLSSIALKKKNCPHRRSTAMIMSFLGQIQLKHSENISVDMVSLGARIWQTFRQQRVHDTDSGRSWLLGLGFHASHWSSLSLQRLQEFRFTRVLTELRRSSGLFHGFIKPPICLPVPTVASSPGHSLCFQRTQHTDICNVQRRSVRRR